MELPGNTPKTRRLALIIPIVAFRTGQTRPGSGVRHRQHPRQFCPYLYVFWHGHGVFSLAVGPGPRDPTRSLAAVCAAGRGIRRADRRRRLSACLARGPARTAPCDPASSTAASTRTARASSSTFLRGCAPGSAGRCCSSTTRRTKVGEAGGGWPDTVEVSRCGWHSS